MDRRILTTMMETQKVRQKGLDQFYTSAEYAKKCIETVFSRYSSFDLIIEPSAGCGSFLHQLPSELTIGLDIDPKCDTIQKMDFFDFRPNPIVSKILVIGNPPFGKVSSLAIRFFNHAAQWSSIIAFVVPRTFRRTSVQNKLNTWFHLVYDTDVPTKPCCFKPPLHVKCCFQIWQRCDTPRNLIHLPTTHPHWTFLSLGPRDANGQPTPPPNADFALRAYGGHIGEIKTEGLDQLRPKSWHWFRSNMNTTLLIERLQQLDYSCGENTARQNSIGKAELVALYVAFLDSKL